MRAGAGRRLLSQLPLAVLALALLGRGAALEAEVERREVEIVAQRLVAAFDATLARSEAVLRTLAASPRLAAQDWPAVHAEARIAAPQVLGNNIVVYDARGWQHVNSLLAADAALPQRPATPAPLVGGLARREAALSDLFVGPVTGTHLAALGLPAGNSTPAEFGVGIGISPDQLARALEPAALPEGWIAAVLDRQGIIAARTREAARFVGQPAIAALREAAQGQREGTLQTRTLEGLEVVLSFRRSAQYGWTVAVAAPRTAGAAWRAFHLVAGGLVVLAAGAAGLALARRETAA